jgi:hypothetical protein
MFEKEILNKSVVELYDNRLIKFASGIITGYKSKSGCIVVDYRVIYPIRHIAKIIVNASHHSHQEKKANM